MNSPITAAIYAAAIAAVRCIEIVRGLGANVIAFGHTADDFCESFLRNAMFTGRISALPAITWSRERDFRLIRPLVYVTEDITTKLRRNDGRAGDSVRMFAAHRHRSPNLRDMFGELEKEHPHLKETLLSAMGNIEPSRLLDPRYLDLDGSEPRSEPDARSLRGTRGLMLVSAVRIVSCLRPWSL